MATTNPQYTDQDVRKYIADKGYTDDTGKVKDEAAGMGIYTDAKQYGIGNDQLDRALNATSGTAQKWISSRNLGGDTDPGTTPVATGKGTLNVPPVADTPAVAPAGLTKSDLDSWALQYAKDHPQAAQPAQAAPVASQTPAPVPAQVAAQAVAERPTSTPWNVTPEQTVQYHLQNLMGQDNPLFTLASQRALRDANAGGIRNSSTGILAAQNAVLDNAFRIASQDANTYAAAASGNLTQNSENSRAGAQLGTGASQFNAGQKNQVGVTTRGQDIQAGQFAQSMGLEYSKLTQQDKQFGIGTMMEDKRLNQQDRQFAGTMALENRKVNTQIDQFAQSMGMTTKELDLKQASLSQQDRQYYNSLLMDRDKLTQQRDQFYGEMANRVSLATMEREGRIQIATLDTNTRKELSNIESAWRLQLGANQYLSQAWGTAITEIGKIQNNPDLEAAAKTDLVQNTLNAFKGYATAMHVSGVDLSSLLDNMKIVKPNDAAGQNNGLARDQQQQVVSPGDG